MLFHTWLTLSAAARQKPRRISPDAATHAISQIGFGNRQYESGAAGASLPSEVFLAWHSAFLSAAKNSGSVILKLTATQVAGRFASGSSSQVSR